MYEVRYTILEGKDYEIPYGDFDEAQRAFDDIKDNVMEGIPDVETVGLYYIDGDGAEKELLVWAR